MFLVPCISPDMSVDENERSVNGVGVSTRGERTVDSGEVAGHPFSRFFSQPPKTDKAKSPDKQQEGQQEIISPDGSFDTLARDPNRMVQQVRIS